MPGAWRRSVLPLLALPAVAFIALPLLALIVRTGPGDLLTAVHDTAARDALSLSTQTSLLALVACILAGTPVAYLLARVEFPGKRVAEALVLLPLVLPPVVGGVALLMAFGRRGVFGDALSALGVELPFTMAGVIAAQVFVAMPFFIAAAKAGFRSVPRHLEEASHTLGVGGWATFFRVTVPLSWPALLSGAVLCWGRALGEFGATLMFAGNIRGATRTMPLAILTAMQDSLGVALALGVILLVFAALIFAVSHFALDRAGQTV